MKFRYILKGGKIKNDKLLNFFNIEKIKIKNLKEYTFLINVVRGCGDFPEIILENHPHP